MNNQTEDESLQIPLARAIEIMSSAERDKKARAEEREKFLCCAISTAKQPWYDDTLARYMDMWISGTCASYSVASETAELFREAGWQVKILHVGILHWLAFYNPSKKARWWEFGFR